MLGDAVLYAASRATSAAVDNASRRVAWAATASGFLLCALVSALIVAYWLIEPRVGTLNAVALISAACGAAGLVCLSLPRLIDGVKERRSRNSRRSKRPWPSQMARPKRPSIISALFRSWAPPSSSVSALPGS